MTIGKESLAHDTYQRFSSTMSTAVSVSTAPVRVWAANKEAVGTWNIVDGTSTGTVFYTTSTGKGAFDLHGTLLSNGCTVKRSAVGVIGVLWYEVD